jgi:hypothetical protein
MSASPSAATLPTAAAAEAFARDGVVVLRGLLTEDEVATLVRGVDRNLADLSPLGMNATEPGKPGAFVEDFRNWQRIEEYESVIRGSALGAAGGLLMASDAVRLFHDHLLVKETISFWIPLDPVARPSTLEFVTGTHTGPWFMPRSFVKKTAMVFDEGALEEVPDVDADRAAFPIKGWALQPGDAVAFNMLTLHAAAGSPARRRAFSVRLTGDDVTWAPRPHRTSPPFPEVELAAGAPLDHPLFPVVWSRGA